MRFRASAVAVLLFGLLPALSVAENLSLRPTLDLSERYDSNVLNAPHGQESTDYVTRATPRLSAVLTLLSSRLALVGGFDAEYHARHDELNKFAVTRNFDLSSGEPMRVTPQLSLRPAARYVESRDAVRRNQLTQVAVPGIAPAETQVTARTGTREYSGSLHADYAFSPNLDLGIGAGATRKSYFDAPTSLVGSNNYRADASAGFRLTPNLSAGLYGTASYDEFDNKNDVRNFTGGLSGNYRFSASTALDVRAGITRIRSDETGSSIDRPSGRFEFSNRLQDRSVSLTGSIDYASGSFGFETKREDVGLRISDRITNDWSWNTAGTWQTNRSLRAPFLEDLMSVQWSAELRYEVTRYARFRLAGEMFRQWNRGGRGSDVYRESATLGFEIGSVVPLI